MENKEFNYNYVAPTDEERKEIDSIRKQYLPQEKVETKLERLRRLDSRVRNSAVIISLVLGVLGCLCFGFGLALVLEWNNWPLGVAFAVIGCVPMGLAYPVYTLVLKGNKKKYGAEILRLSEEILKKE
ncbi:MAG: hypothetical protein IJW60_01715 [Clostridia bacterium]|nr:hypothetical protein [Clostridia bacterium]